jgi:hypothetical protein
MTDQEIQELKEWYNNLSYEDKANLAFANQYLN